MEEVVRKAVVAAGKPPAVGWMSQTAHNRGCRGLVVGRGRCGSMLCPPHKFFQYSTATNKRRRGLLGQRKEPTDTFTTTTASATAASPFTGSRGFEELGLHHELVSALQRRLSPSLQCSPQPMPVQQRVLPLALKQEQQDLLVQAPTGSGKTLAYVLPALQLLRRLPETTASAAPSATEPSPLTNCSPFVLIMTPTRELCRQVYEELVALYQPQAASTRACVQLHGGVPYSVQEQILRSGNVKVVVGTPGRLLDHIERNNVDFHQVKLLVLDEADEMLCSEHHTIVSRIVTRELPRDRQTMMFSATLPEVVMDTAAKYTCPTACTRIAVDETSSKERKDVSSSAVGLYTEDTVLSVGWQHNLPPNVQHQAIPVDAGPASHQAVSDLLLFHGPKSAIVFTKTRSEADEVAKKLYENRFNVHMLHSDLKQEEREKCIELFRTGSITVLVATDLAARGLDIPTCELVIQLQPPNQLQYYVHRTGRTGRAGRSGLAILLYSKKQHQKTVEKLFLELKVPLKEVSLPSREQLFSAVLRNAAQRILEADVSPSNNNKKLGTELLEIATETWDKLKQRGAKVEKQIQEQEMERVEDEVGIDTVARAISVVSGMALSLDSTNLAHRNRQHNKEGRKAIERNSDNAEERKARAERKEAKEWQKIRKLKKLLS